MASPSHRKTLHSPHVFSMKTPSSSSSSSSSLASMKLKTLIHNFIFSHLYRIARSITKAKSILIELLKEIQLNIHFLEPMLKKNKNKHNDKLIFGSFRLHYNWCSSSQVVTMSLPGDSNVYYDSTWNSIISSECDDLAEESQLSGYLHWLEETKVHGGNSSICSSITEEMNEIDQLADKFIANCHEKFRLEKQESYRRFQEMMARSV